MSDDGRLSLKEKLERLFFGHIGWIGVGVGVYVMMVLADLWPLPTPQKPAETPLNIVMQVGAIALGFLGTALTILLALADRPFAKWLKANGHLKAFNDYAMRGIFVWFIAL